MRGLSLWRLRRDWQAAQVHKGLLAETCVDPARFAGTDYRAPNGHAGGRTRGSGRTRADALG